MPPKPKSPRGKGAQSAKPTGAAAWESALATTSFNQDDWRTFVCFLTPDTAVNQIYIDLIEKSVTQGLRRRFDIIAKQELLESIKSLGKVGKNTKNQTASAAAFASSQFIGAYEHAKQTLDNGEEISDQLWGKLIKSKLLDFKKDVKNRTAIVTSAKAAANSNTLKVEKPKSPGGKKSPKPPAMAKKTPLPTQISTSDAPIEKSTSVKTRDQIIDETKYIDDEPKDGVNQYVLLSGFNSVNIIQQLEDLDVIVDSVMNVSCDEIEETKRLYNEMIQREHQEQTLKADVLKDTMTSEQAAAEMHKNEQALNSFWTNLLPTLDNANDRSMLQDIVLTDLKVLGSVIPSSWNNAEERIRLSQSLYSAVADIAYRLVQRKRQYVAFNQQMKVLPIPVTEEKLVDNSSDAKNYTELTSLVPSESISISLVLHSILEQVEVQSAQKEKPVQPRATCDDITHYLREKLLSLSMHEGQQKEVENIVPKSPFVKATGSGPNMIYWCDNIKQRLTTLNGLETVDLMKIEQDLLSFTKLASLSILPRITPDQAQQREARLNELLHFCTDEELVVTDVDHALKQFVFECMQLTAPSTDSDMTAQSTQINDDRSVYDKHFIKLDDNETGKEDNICWDDPYPDIIQLMSVENDKTGLISSSTPSPVSSSPRSQSGKGSILRDRSQSPKRSDSDLGHSVRFDVNNPEDAFHQVARVNPFMGDVNNVMQNIKHFHKRNLNDWNFAEHFEPNVFAQVIDDAIFTHSHIDTYYNRRDHTHMVVLSMPVPEGKTMAFENVNRKLFSDVGFRNFLDEISYEIVDWLRDEEAKYQAELLAKEVQTYLRQASGASNVTAAEKKVASAVKKTSRSPSDTSDSGNDTDDEHVIKEDYVYQNSLKAWKTKKDKEVLEQKLDQQSKESKGKKPSSAAGKRSPRATSAEKKNTGTKSPPKSKSPKAEKESKHHLAQSNMDRDSKESKELKEKSENEMFIGYSLGNKLLSVQSDTTHLLVPDGCFIRTKVDSFKRGNTHISTMLHRNRSIYKVQLLNPLQSFKANTARSEVDKYDGEQQQEKDKVSMSSATTLLQHPQQQVNNEQDEASKSINASTNETKSKKVADYGVFTAQLNSGMILTCSTYNQEPPKSIEIQGAQTVTEPPPPPPVTETPHEDKLDDKKKDAKQKKKGKPVEVEPPPVEKPEEPQFTINPFQRLTVSIPTGLVITYYPETFVGVKPTEDNTPHRLTVKQFYASCSKGYHSCEQSRINAYQENSRIIESNGNVMIFKRNGEVTVLCPDGEMFMRTMVSQAEPDMDTPEQQSPQQTIKKDVRDAKAPVGKKKPEFKQEDIPIMDEKPTYEWRCISADGQVFIQNIPNGDYEKIGNMRLILESNPKTSEQVIHREDKVVIVYRVDNTRLVIFPDGTRITTYHAIEQRNNNYHGDHETGEKNYEKIPHVKVEAPGYATVAFNCQTSDCRTIFSDGSLIEIYANGTYSVFECEGEKFDINENGDVLFDFQQSTFSKRTQEILTRVEPAKFILSQNADLLLDGIDHEQTQYCVESTGDTYSKTASGEKEYFGSMELHVPRYFIVHQDGSGTELLRFKDLYNYLRTMDLDPGTAVVREPLLSNPKITGATVMKPFQDEIHKRWSTVYDDDSILPKSLRNNTATITRSYSSFSDSGLSNNPKTNPSRSDTSAILRNVISSNQQKSTITMTPTALTPQPLYDMPKALVYRQFLEFPRVNDDIRLKLFRALKAYIEFVKDRADYHVKLLPQDYRTKAEREKATKIWRLVRPQGNTKDDLILLYMKTVHPDRGKTNDRIKQQSVVPLSRKFDLERLDDELRQEKLNKKLKRNLSKGIVEPYFKSEWGKAYLKQDHNGTSRGGTEQRKLDTKSSPISVTDRQKSQQQRTDRKALSARDSRMLKNSDNGGSGDGSSSVDTAAAADDTPHSRSNKKYLEPFNNLQKLRESFGHSHEQPNKIPTNRSVSTEVEDNQTVSMNQYDGTFRPYHQSPIKKNYKEFDAMGNRRFQAIKLPTGIKGARPNAERHTRFLEMEEPMKVRPNNASIGVSYLNNRPLRERRGCELYPDRIDFGILKEVKCVTYATDIEIKNVGIDSCRFRIRQPPLGTGLRVVFQPGMLAAGIKRPITIELYALIGNNNTKQSTNNYGNGLSQLDQKIEIITETDIMHLPVRAKIASEEQFDTMFVNNDETAGMNKSTVRLIARRSPNTNDWLITDQQKQYSNSKVHEYERITTTTNDGCIDSTPFSNSDN